MTHYVHCINLKTKDLIQEQKSKKIDKHSMIVIIQNYDSYHVCASFLSFHPFHYLNTAIPKKFPKQPFQISQLGVCNFPTGEFFFPTGKFLPA